jgi:hypothetical protein
MMVVTLCSVQSAFSTLPHACSTTSTTGATTASYNKSTERIDHDFFLLSPCLLILVLSRSTAFFCFEGKIFMSILSNALWLTYRVRMAQSRDAAWLRGQG